MAINHLIDPLLLRLYIIVRAPVRFERLLEALQNATLRRRSLVVKPAPVSVFGVLAILEHIVFRREAIQFFTVHIFHELLPSLQVLDALVRPLLLLLEFYDSIFNLRLLVLLPLGNDDCIHHNVVRSSTVDGAHAGR